MADNETPEVGTFDALDTSPEGHVLDWSGLTSDAEADPIAEAEPIAVPVLDPEGLWPEYHTLELVELRAIRELLQVQVTQFGTVVQIVTELAAKADGLFSGDGDAPQIGGPAGLILSALLPKRR